MKHAPKDSAGATTLPAAAPGGLTAGLDWAKDDHVVCIVDGAGEVVGRFTVSHTNAGLKELLARLAKVGCREVAIERPDGPVVSALLEAALTVVVISPNQLKNLRSRYGSAGNKDDRFDAYVLADALRTDRARLRPLLPDSPATLALRATCRARKDLVGHRVALANQLRAHLQTALPGAVGLFAELDSPISLKFLSRFDSQDKLDWLSPKRLAAQRRLLRPHRPQGAAHPAARRAPRPDRSRRRRPRTHHRRAARRLVQPRRTDQGAHRANR